MSQGREPTSRGKHKGIWTVVVRPLPVHFRKAEKERENIKEAVRHGKATADLLEMLEEATQKIQRLRTELVAEPNKIAPRSIPGLVERYANDLRSVLGRDTERARAMLARLLGDIVLRPNGEGLVAELRANVTAAAGFETTGAGSPFPVPSNVHRLKLGRFSPSVLRKGKARMDR